MSVALPPSSVDGWLSFQQQLHPHAIALGLDRVGAVWRALGARRPAPTVITVGGTNGKGSTVAFLDAMLRAGGYRCGTYTSPHLLKYNERIAIDGVPVDDPTLSAAFARIEAARADVPLTVFEYGTLAAFLVLAAADLDAAVLEVGMGGRLDAVNLIDADAAIVTTVDLDHQAFLGPDREAIGAEKAPIFRAGRPAVIGDVAPPASVLEHAAAIGARALRRGVEFDVAVAEHGRSWAWIGADGTLLELPLPLHLPGAIQITNAGNAIAALRSLFPQIVIDDAAAAAGVRDARLLGRLTRIGVGPETFVDVAHNPQAARVLAGWLAEQPPATTAAVFAALGDKDIAGVVSALEAQAERWFLAPLDRSSARGLPVDALAARVAAVIAEARIERCGSVADAIAAARHAVGAQGRVIVFGSFLTVAAALAGDGAGSA